MPSDCAQLVADALDLLRIEFLCAPEGQGVSVVTPYLRSDNGQIEVFVEDWGNQVRVSDLGETLRHLKMRGADPLASTKGRFIIEQTTARLHVTLNRGRLEKLSEPTGAGEALLDVAAASQALDGLIYTSRALEPASFPHEVGSFLSEHKVEYTPDFQIAGQSGKAYKVGFHFVSPVTGTGVLLQPLSPSQPSGATALVNKTVRMWVDLDAARPKISLLNDVDYEWRREDSVLLGRLSAVARWSEKEAIFQEVA